MRSWAVKCLTGTALAAVALSGCKAPRQVSDPDFARINHEVALASHQSPEVATTAASPSVSPSFSEPQHLDAYLQIALEQNPKIQAARKVVEAKAYQVPQAASLEDPNLNVMGYPFNPYVPQQAAGRVRSEVTVSQKLTWIGKLRSASSAAEAETDMARASLAAAELEVVERTTRAYYELAYAERALTIIKKQRELLVDVINVAEVQYRTNKVSQQDVLRAQVELANTDSELVRARQELAMAQASLARQLHISPDSPLATEGDVSVQTISQDLQLLYDTAIAMRPELQAQLAQVERDRYRVDLARAQYVPDVTVAADWGNMTRSQALAPEADGLDMFGVGLMVNVPIYRKRLEAGVRQAEAEVVASAREYDVKRDEVLEEIRTLYVTARSQQELLSLLDSEIIPKTEQTFRVSLRSYEVGQIDLLQLIDNRRQLLVVQLNRQRLASQSRQTVAALERAIGGYRATPVIRRLPQIEQIPIAPEPVETIPEGRR